MEIQRSRAIEKLSMVMQHLPMGFAEIDKEGRLIYLNIQGEILLKPIWIANSISGDNLYPILDCIDPVISKKIQDSSDTSGNILTDKVYRFSLAFGGETVERHFRFMVVRMFADCIIIVFDDITKKRGREQAIQELQSEKAMVQGKFEIASNILHDIGNAMVAFGSHITRVKRVLEENNYKNLENLAGLFEEQQEALLTVFGEPKATAVVNMIKGISEGQKKGQIEISKSVADQLNVITHIQAILNIQRQYVNGHDVCERKPVRLVTVIEDCYSMLFASLEKRGIKINIDIPDNLPLISADKNSLMQVILNVLKNSIEAIDLNAEKKNISINVTAGEGVMTVKITDNGSGFDKTTAEQIFKRGFTTKASGSGLGLNHCRMIIEKHDGSMDMISAGFGKGAQTIIKFRI